jgi:hypothetical protein
VEYRKIKDLTKNPDNPRTIKDVDFERLKASILKSPDFFEARPLILSDRTGKLVIIGGNQRFEAAKALGKEEVPTFLISGLDEDREREIVVRDNIANGEWDWDLLTSMFDEFDLKEWGLTLPEFKTEFDDDEEIDGDGGEDKDLVIIKINRDEYALIEEEIKSVLADIKYTILA